MGTERPYSLVMGVGKDPFRKEDPCSRMKPGSKACTRRADSTSTVGHGGLL